MNRNSASPASRDASPSRMRGRFTTPFTAALTVVLMGCSLAFPSLSASPERLPLQADWLFHPGDPHGASKPGFDDSAWSPKELPHDWSIEGTIAPENPSEGGGGFFPTGTAWYRHHFRAPANWEGRRISILFEGVYRNAEVWLNGEPLGSQAYGYSPFRLDLSPHLRPGEENLIAVRVENEPQPNSRWYTGSGIYRPVWLEVEQPVHLEPESVFFSTRDLNASSATVDVSTTIRNTAADEAIVTVELTLLDQQGTRVAHSSFDRDLAAGTSETLTGRLDIEQPRPWSPADPYLYEAVARVVLANGEEVDRKSFHVGLRTIRISAERGFELNGETLKLLGGNVHHDTGVLGAAAFARAEERKVELLKEAGFNAVRTAHNPPSSAFLEACDRLGLLVIDESFDAWKSGKLPHDYGELFEEHAEADLRAMLLRDRNHPSVVMWSTGNEVYERGNEAGIRRAHKLAGIVRQIDRSRPVTIGLNGLGETGDWTRLDALFDVHDVVGYNYELQRHAEDHERRPNRVIYASESYQTEAFENWQIVTEHPYVIGDFVWSAIDYLGEAGIGRVFGPGEEVRAHWEGSHFPWHGAWCGDIDLTGFRKPISHYRQIVWDRGKKLYAAVHVPGPDGRDWQLSQWAVPPMMPSWTWPGHEGESLRVEVFSRHETVRLYLNGELVGEEPTTEAEAFKAVFELPYQPGTLEAVGLAGGREVERFSLQTAHHPAKLQLDADRLQLTADGQDLSFIEVEIHDAESHWHPHAEPSIEYQVEGPGRIIGIGSGNLWTTQGYQENPRKAFQGRAIIVVRTTTEPGTITLRASAEGLAPATLQMQAVAP